MLEALRWYEQAARQGHDAAMYNLAFSYRMGDGVPQDYTQMHYWLEKAAALGHRRAKMKLRYLGKRNKN